MWSSPFWREAQLVRKGNQSLWRQYRLSNLWSWRLGWGGGRAGRYRRKEKDEGITGRFSLRYEHMLLITLRFLVFGTSCDAWMYIWTAQAFTQRVGSIVCYAVRCSVLSIQALSTANTRRTEDSLRKHAVEAVWSDVLFVFSAQSKVSTASLVSTALRYCTRYESTAKMTQVVTLHSLLLRSILTCCVLNKSMEETLKFLSQLCICTTLI